MGWYIVDLLSQITAATCEGDEKDSQGEATNVKRILGNPPIG
jgi:hypothetical protein